MMTAPTLDAVHKNPASVAGLSTQILAAMLMADMNDTLNAFSDSVKARDRILAANKCGTTTVPYDWDGDPKTPSVCVQYQGCTPGFPVVWCPTMGLGHSSQIPTSTVGVWRFWSQL